MRGCFIQGHLQPPEDPRPTERSDIEWISYSSHLLHSGETHFGHLSLLPDVSLFLVGQPQWISLLFVTFQSLASGPFQDSPNQGYFLCISGGSVDPQGQMPCAENSFLCPSRLLSALLSVPGAEPDGSYFRASSGVWPGASLAADKKGGRRVRSEYSCHSISPFRSA